MVDLSNSLIEEDDFLLSRAWDIVKSACASIRDATQTC